MKLIELVSNFGTFDWLEIGFCGSLDPDLLFCVGFDDFSRFNDYQVEKFAVYMDSSNDICLRVEIFYK